MTGPMDCLLEERLWWVARSMFQALCKQIHKNLIAGTCPWCQQAVVEGVVQGRILLDTTVDQADVRRLLDQLIERLDQELSDRDVFAIRLAFEELLCDAMRSAPATALVTSIIYSGDRIVINVNQQSCEVKIGRV